MQVKVEYLGTIAELTAKRSDTEEEFTVKVLRRSDGVWFTAGKLAIGFDDKTHFPSLEAVMDAVNDERFKDLSMDALNKAVSA